MANDDDDDWLGEDFDTLGQRRATHELHVTKLMLGAYHKASPHIDLCVSLKPILR
eukprot:CAMPEP_0118712184 /NCGR_PEP_ID=MMETSP0800-20121206/24623_1 /TAXON_ID=210618 ORGANISM="Striatella unipunctata, Strain CCMP2910" /NCGR_SAMPLE_ID=MMETSP0800 /ASSEMBLY_ACC=CAM_ASM_000638 /LENGTH=54 /DNA_ID=CAMNT_0006617103 /DNA_START=69 /DNA_END=229 /DNA_ORIENTATION=-